MILTRRHLIALAGAGAAVAPRRLVYGSGQDFWNAKDPAEWTSDEVARLLKKSPWSKPVTGTRTTTTRNPSPSTDTSLPTPTMSGRPRTTGMATNRIPRNPSSQTTTVYQGVVVWESAKVIRDAAKWDLPAGFEGQYVLSLTGIPLAKTSSKSSMDSVRQLTMLQAKGHDPLEAALVQQKADNGAVYLIGFSREAMPIAKEDKEVTFTTRLGRILFTAKFSPKEMLYHGDLAV
jgi:hypothetical protein